MKRLSTYTFLLSLLVGTLDVRAQNINHPNIQCPGAVQVNSFNGNMYLERQDLFIRGRKLNFDISFSYNSRNFIRDQGFGNGWSFEYSTRYRKANDTVIIARSDGREDVFRYDSLGKFAAPSGIFDSLGQYQPGKYVLVTKRRWKYFFDDSTHKRLTRIEEPNGNFLSFGYTDSLITSITDASARSLSLSYNGGKLATVTDALDQPVRTIQYAYDAYGNLKEVTDPLGNKSKYQYQVSGPMTAVIDKNGNTVNVIYNSGFGVNEVISCITNQRFSYSTVSKTTTLVESVGGENQVTFYKFDEQGNLKQKKGNCCGFNVSYEYDLKGNITQSKDANGNLYKYTYDGRGNLLSEVDPLNHTSFYTYDPVFNNITSYTDKNGNTTTYSYDSKGNLLQINAPLGLTTSFTYASNGDRLSYTDGKGNITAYAYNTKGDLITIHRPLNVDINLTYDGRSRRTGITDPRAHTTLLAYDRADRIISITDATNHSFNFSYDAVGNITKLVDRKAHSTRFFYDALNRLTSIKDALGHVSSIEYDAKSNMLALTDANNHKTKFAYDKLNRLVAITDAAAESTLFTYDNGTNITSITAANGNHFSLSYDALNRITQVSDDIGVISARTYDNMDNLLTISDANGNSRTYTYDALDRRSSLQDPVGKSIQYSYDKNFNLLSLTDRNNHTRQYSYDNLNRLIAFTDANNGVTGFSYDSANNIISITDANNHITTYAYDVLNRNTQQTFADNTTNLYTYDANGNITSRIDNKGTVTNYVYDSLNRLVKRDYPGSNDDQFSYDAIGKILTAINANATVSFTYDAANRMMSEALNGKTTQYSYNTSTNTETVQYPGGRNFQRKSDVRKRLSEIKEGNKILAAFVYDGANRLVAKNYPANNTTTNYSYDANNRITSMVANQGSILGFDYGYDFEGNKLFEKKLHRPAHSEQYAYNNKYELTGFKRGTLNGNSIPSPVHQHQYNYDALGNRTTVIKDQQTSTYSTNSMNAYIQITGLDSATFQYDNNGNLINDGTNTYSYDHESGLMAVNNGTTARYTYDALGRRTRKAANNTTTDFLYSGIHEIEVRDSATGSIKSSFVYGPGLDNILSARANSNNYFYYNNNLGSVNAVADSAGGLVERYEYDPFGEVAIFDPNGNSIASSSFTNNIFFTGRTLDHETGKFFYRARHYETLSGRFIQRDPLKYADGFNMYAYVGNNVLNTTDPLGLLGYNDDGIGAHMAFRGTTETVVKNPGLTVRAFEALRLVEQAEVYRLTAMTTMKVADAERAIAAAEAANWALTKVRVELAVRGMASTIAANIGPAIGFAVGQVVGLLYSPPVGNPTSSQIRDMEEYSERLWELRLDEEYLFNNAQSQVDESYMNGQSTESRARRRQRRPMAPPPLPTMPENNFEHPNNRCSNPYGSDRRGDPRFG